jgi:hypothetical protein
MDNQYNNEYNKFINSLYNKNLNMYIKEIENFTALLYIDNDYEIIYKIYKNDKNIKNIYKKIYNFKIINLYFNIKSIDVVNTIYENVLLLTFSYNVNKNINSRYFLIHQDHIDKFIYIYNYDLYKLIEYYDKKNYKKNLNKLNMLNKIKYNN